MKPGLVLGEHLAPVMNSCESSPGKHDPVAALLQPCGGTPVCGSHAFYFPWPRLFTSAQAFKENQSQRVSTSYSIWTNLICRYKAINNCHKTTHSHLLGQKVHCTSLIDFRYIFFRFFFFPSEQYRPSAVNTDIPQHLVSERNTNFESKREVREKDTEKFRHRPIWLEENDFWFY